MSEQVRRWQLGKDFDATVTIDPARLTPEALARMRRYIDALEMEASISWAAENTMPTGAAAPGLDVKQAAVIDESGLVVTLRARPTLFAGGDPAVCDHRWEPDHREPGSAYCSACGSFAAWKDDPRLAEPSDHDAHGGKYLEPFDRGKR